MNSNNFNYKQNGNFSDSLVEISKTLENFKGHRFSLEKEIENEELYKEKLYEKLKNYQNELMRINDDKSALMDVYSKILRESDDAYSKIVRSTEALFKMVQIEEKKVKSTTTKKFEN